MSLIDLAALVPFYLEIGCELMYVCIHISAY